ncbi:MAG: GerW family sporulation protein, partial [Firmicutes bacterium]|nr:GerW family sporulation protein [Bacillota bacterium]
LIPVINDTFGMGTGGGTGEGAKANTGQKGGAGAGLGAKISPTAVIVIKEGDISVIPINGTVGLERLIDMVPDIVKKIKIKAGQGQKKDHKKEPKKDQAKAR